MKLSCLQENLSRGLGIVGRAVATRTTLPVTQNVLLSTDQSMLRMSATNLEIAITTWIGAMVEEEGSVTVPARLLTEFVASLPADRINIDMAPGTRTLQLSCARSEARINGTDAEEFPPIPEVESALAGKVDPKVLNEAITHVAFAAATEDSRPVLTGVQVELSGDDFTFAGADGFRLAVYKGKLEAPVSEDANFIVPARSLQEVSRSLDGSDDPVEFMVTPTKGQALFKFGNVELVTQLVQGTFPNYSQLIPDSFDTRAVVDLAAFLGATRTASILARDGAGIVRLQVTEGDEGEPGKLSIVSTAEEVGENRGDIDAQVEGGEAKIAFNSRYLADVLAVLEQDSVALEVTTPSSPGVVRPVGSDAYVHVVMPMFVQW
jgi:DNA polymerase-3 subunit beta